LFRRASRAGGCLSLGSRASAGDSGAVIRTETKLVLVDTVVTDKKGNYIHDLEAKDFKVWEDNKEQADQELFVRSRIRRRRPIRKSIIWCCSSTTRPWISAIRRARGRPREIHRHQRRSQPADGDRQFRRRAANRAEFHRRYSAAEKCREWVKFSAVAPNASDANAPQLSAQMASFGARDVLYALKDLAKSLSAIPGRKTVILITGGFPLTPEIMSEATAAISACNKANVAIYPIDVRGLVAGTPQARLTAPDKVACALFPRLMFRAAWRSSCRNMAADGRRREADRRRRWPSGGGTGAARRAVVRQGRGSPTSGAVQPGRPGSREIRESVWNNSPWSNPSAQSRTDYSANCPTAPPRIRTSCSCWRRHRRLRHS
jgi:hypothetical protein